MLRQVAVNHHCLQLLSLLYVLLYERIQLMIRVEVVHRKVNAAGDVTATKVVVPHLQRRMNKGGLQ